MPIFHNYEKPLKVFSGRVSHQKHLFGFPENLSWFFTPTFMGFLENLPSVYIIVVILRLMNTIIMPEVPNEHPKIVLLT
jgi:hypothetical protein